MAMWAVNARSREEVATEAYTCDTRAHRTAWDVLEFLVRDVSVEVRLGTGVWRALVLCAEAWP